MVYPHIYHVYNRGNNRQPIFFNRANYLFFLQKMRVHLVPTCDFLAYCLMPNHFHFLIKMKAETMTALDSGGTTSSRATTASNSFSHGLRILLSSYTRAIQKQENITGSLFQQNTRHKQVSSEWMWEDYTLTCFRYILQNPVQANLTSHPADWEFSSYRDLVGLRHGTLCNRKCIEEELALHLNNLEEIMGKPLLLNEIDKIW